MEFPFDINQLFSERVSILDHTLVAGRKSAGMPHLQAHIATVIDELGRASAKAQQLPASITSASKLQSQRHQLYLLKDGESNGGRGAAMGFLKVGYKKLFLLDRQGAHVEAEPLCVLDFYIAENVQRHGYGLELFDFMLQHKNLEPVLMAYDRPSPKFLSFLGKHYCLTPSVPQGNNFVVFEGFFLNRSAAKLRKVPLKKPDGEIKPYSLMEREVVLQEQRARPWPFVPPHSPQRSASSQCSHSLSVGSSPSRAPPRASPASAPGDNKDLNPQSPLIERCRARRSRSQPLSLPPLCAPKKNAVPRKTSLDRKERLLDSHAEARGAEEEIRLLDGAQRPAPGMLVSQRDTLEKESDGGRRGWSWTVGENCYTAQWVKQKQEHRSTRPW
ncbi:alpha-tubulin N-acetyltransferase 1 isoform X4 [Anoplopoma fimbria]|uniref:alpha-tubulin N-acetyltransferase 1 isoform X4 n=1 Tax=Anoplopoma fimbria TaxID=229290 RepID=UPI0023EC898A|nr:alpha-tubulin N-acetyltransferase 1 isoform X4 [Anoplopoma fimbria]